MLGRLLLAIILLAVPAQAKNVVFILVDDLRWDAMSYMGHPVQTPSIDQLAAEGVRFANAFAVDAICSPSRATMLTGVYPNKHGVTGNGMLLRDIDTIADALQSTHMTGMFGKWHLSKNYSVVPSGWDKFYALWGQGRYFDPIIYDNGVRKTVGGYSTDILTDKAIEFIEENVDQPFFVYLAFKGVHSPYTPPPRHVDTLSNIDWELTNRPNSTNDAFARKQKYQELLLAVDDNVGRVLDAIEANGISDETMVIFTSDNGLHHREHARHDKRTFFEESIRVPLIIKKPRVNVGQVRAQVALNIDIAPTILDFLGGELGHQVDGMSLLPVVDRSIEQTRVRWLYTYFRDLEYPDLPTMYAWIVPGYKYVRFPDGWDLFCYFDGNEMLFNRFDDPFELDNIFGLRPRSSGLEFSMSRAMDRALNRLDVQWVDYDSDIIWDRVQDRYGDKISLYFPNGFTSTGDRVCPNGTYWE